MRLFGAVDPATQVTQALRQASAQTGVGFDYLLNTAMRESSLDANAAARTSSASGLFQFIESTWLETVKTAGHDLGLGHVADQIQRSADGRYTVADPAAREQILALRNDPETSALMAAALTQRNAGQLAAGIGREPTGGELYIAHFLGAGDGARLIQLAKNNPQADAAAHFPRAAKANPAIFNTPDGAPRTVAQVHAGLTHLPDAALPVTDKAGADAAGQKIAGFFSALFRPGGAARPDTAPASATPPATPETAQSGAAVPERKPGEPLDLASFMSRGGGGLASHFGGDAARALQPGGEPAAQRLAAHGAYNTQVRWFAALYRG